MKNVYLGLGLAICLGQSAQAQLVVNNTMTPEQLVQEVLLGAGVVATNITFNGQPGNTVHPQAGTFNAENAVLGIPSGVMLSSGDIAGALGPNNASGFSMGGGNFGVTDPDLEDLSNVTINDAAVLEFDFVPTGDSIKFSFIFASEEYPEYVCGTVNDAFGFFLSGPGINGPFTNNAINLALIPGGSVPISINSVNPGTVGTNGSIENCNGVDPDWTANNIYYEGNGDGFTAPFNTDPQYLQYDGRTVMLVARAQVVCGETYHIKMAIGDGGDTAFDSAVFLEEGSFASPPAIPSLIPGIGVLGDTIFQSCFDVEFVFTRTGDIDDTDTVNLVIGGTAVAGANYVPAMPTQIIFEPGVTEVPFTFNAPQTNAAPVTLTISVIIESECFEEQFQADFDFIIKKPRLLVAIGELIEIECGDSALLAPTITGGYGAYHIHWPDGQPGDSLWVSPDESTDYQIQVTDTCGLSTVAYFGVGLPPSEPLNIQTTDLVVPCSGDSIPISAQVSGGYGQLSVVWNNGDTGPASFASGLLDGTYTVTVSDECGRVGTGSVSVDVLCDLIIPNVVTPNGDGYNDFWEIQGILSVNGRVNVWNRWGNKVFESMRYQNNWSPKDLPDGTYYYEIIVDNEDKPHTGTLTVLGRK
ncbi:MAG TPA: choice-of-anchor L domain-containing protein [Flavobacteriales bacterium]